MTLRIGIDASRVDRGHRTARAEREIVQPLVLVLHPEFQHLCRGLGVATQLDERIAYADPRQLQRLVVCERIELKCVTAPGTLGLRGR